MGSAPRKTRTTSLHDDAYAVFVATLVKLRKDSGLKQWHIANALGWNQSIVSKIEKRQRRIDIVELIRVAHVIGFDPAALVRKIQKQIRAHENEESQTSA